MAIIYLLSVAALWSGIMLIRKSGEKQNLLVWVFLSAMMVMCFQTLFGGIVNKLGIAVTLVPMGLGNLAGAAGCFLHARRKGRQEYEVKALDIISVALLLGIILLFGFSKYGRHLDTIDFVSVDATAHCRDAIGVALEHRLPINLYFSCLNTGLMMQVYQGLTGAGRFDLYRVFLWCELFYTALAALLFWGLVRQRCGEGKWQRFVPLLLTPFYWAGYPVYSTLFGFSYLGMSVCLYLVILTLLDQYFHERIGRGWFIAGLNLTLYGIIVSYTLFVPAAFFGVFAALAWDMRKKGKLISKENIVMMLEVFLIPTALGLIYSISNVEALAPGGGIINEGGCYNDIYANFILPAPFMILGIYFLVSRKDGGWVLPMTWAQVIAMAVMLAGLMTRRVSVYYYSKMNSIFWVLCWVLVAEAILGMMKHCKWAVLFPFLFYGILFCGKYADTWLERANPLAGRVKVWNFCDLILINNTYFNFSPVITEDTIALDRYADEHFEPGEVVGVFQIRENGWFNVLTDQRDIFVNVGYEDFLREVEEKGYRYICAGYGNTYDDYREYLEMQETVMENDGGKILKITVKPGEMPQSESSPGEEIAGEPAEEPQQAQEQEAE